MLTPRKHEWTGVLNREIFDEYPGEDPTKEDLRRWRLFRNAYHGAQQFADAPFPPQLNFELNSSCNLKCKFCLHGHREFPKSEISLDQFKRLIDEGEQYGLCSIKLNNINEPLLKRDLPEYIRYARQHGVLNVYLATNGTLLTRGISEQLITAGLTKLMVSLDAVRPETYAKIRGEDKFNLVCRNIINFIALRNDDRKRFPLVRVNFLKTELNAIEAGEFIRTWADVADSIGFQDGMGFDEMDDEARRELFLNSRNGFRCSFPFKMLSVNSYGEIQPCCGFEGREMVLGHIDSMTLKEAWDSPAMQDIKLMHRTGEIKNIQQCSRCLGRGVE